MENRQNLAMILMSRGGDGSVIDSSRRTPLYYAVEKGYTRYNPEEVREDNCRSSAQTIPI